MMEGENDGQEFEKTPEDAPEKTPVDAPENNA